MPLFEVIDNKSKVQVVKYYPEFSAVCIIGKLPFYGTMEIVYYPDAVLLEFISFEKWLEDAMNIDTTIEDLTSLVFDGLREVLGDIPLRVTCFARTTVHAPVSATIESEEMKCQRN